MLVKYDVSCRYKGLELKEGTWSNRFDVNVLGILQGSFRTGRFNGSKLAFLFIEAFAILTVISFQWIFHRTIS